MITKDFNMDIRKYKTIFMAGFSGSEFASVAACAGSMYLVYYLEMNVFNLTRINYIFFTPCLIFLAFGFAKPCGLPLRKYLKNNWRYMLAPKERVCKIKNSYSEFAVNEYIEDGDFLLDETETVQETEENSKKKKKNKKQISAIKEFK